MTSLLRFIFSLFVINGCCFAQTTSTTSKAESDFNTLKSFVGQWKMNAESFVNEQADSLFKPGTFIIDIHETQYGIEFVTHQTFLYAGKAHSNVITEHFIPDKGIQELRYFSFDKSSTGNVTTATGKAFFENNNLIILGSYPDRPNVTGYEHRFSNPKDNLIRHTGIYYDKDGKGHTWHFNLTRM